MKRVQPATNFEWYGIVSTGKTQSVQVTIDQKPDCFNTNNFNPSLPIIFTLSNTNPTESVTIENYNLDGTLNGEPFVVNIGAVDCLGPRRISTLSGEGTCCDVTNLYLRWESADESADFNAIYFSNFIFSAGTIGYEFDEMYMCPQNPRAFDFSHWSNSSFLKTQKLKTTTQVICEGDSPILEDNNATTSGSISVGEFTPIDYPSNKVEVNFEPSGDFYNICQECRVLEEDEAFILNGPLGRLSLGTNTRTQSAQNGIYLEQNRTIRRLQGSSCYNVYQERECQEGTPTWVDRDSTILTLSTRTETESTGENTCVDVNYKERCIDGGWSETSRGSEYTC